MPLKRSVRMLSSLERQALKTQWLHSRCARCFHASIRQLAKAPTSESRRGASHNAPKQALSRRERSAKIANEVSMLQKGPPPSGDSTGPGSATGSYQAPPQAPNASAGFLKTPGEMGGPRMGENVSAGREGPNAQGVGRPIRYEDRGDAVEDTTNLARGVRAPHAVEEPAEGGASASTPGHHREWVNRSAQDDDSTAWNNQQESRLRQKISKAAPSGIPIKPTLLDAKALLQDSRGASTIAANNFAGVIRDRLSQVSTPAYPSQPPRWRTISREDKVPSNHEMSKLVIDKFVKGSYDPRGQMTGDKFKQATLNDVARYTLLNGSFLPGDGERVLSKVKALLPAATAATARPQKQAARK